MSSRVENVRSRNLRRMDSSVVPLSAVRAADAFAVASANAVPKIAGLLNYLQLGNDEHVHRCLDRTGKNPLVLDNAHVHAAHLANSQLHSVAPGGMTARMQKAKALVEVESKELQAMTPDQVMSRLRSKFESYCNAGHYADTGRHEISLRDTLRLLRDAQLLDNRLGLREAARAFSNAHADKGLPPREGEERHITFEVFLTSLKDMLLVKRPPVTVATRSSITASPDASGASASSGPSPTATAMRGGGLGAERSVSGGHGHGHSHGVAPEFLTALFSTRQHPSPLERPAATSMQRQRKSFSGVGLCDTTQPGLLEDPELVAVARSHLALHARNDGAADARSINAVYLPEMLSLLRQWDLSLRTVFAWYASLGASDPRCTTWEAVRAAGGTAGRSETMLLLLNFRVVPALVTRNDALDAFSRHARETHPAVNTHGKGDPQFYPAFLESLANIAIAVADGMEARIRGSVSSPDDMRSLLRYIKGVPEKLGEQLQEVYDAQSAAWSASLIQPAAFGFLSAAARDNVLAAAAARAEADTVSEDKRQAVLLVAERREALRMSHALVRLNNSTRDVRTAGNNLVWPLNHATGTLHPSLRTCANTYRAAAGHLHESGAPLPPAAGGGRGHHANSAQHPHCNAKHGHPARVAVSFFSDQTQIKSPRTAPVGGGGGGGIAHGYGGPMMTASASATAGWAQTTPWAGADDARSPALSSQRGGGGGGGGATGCSSGGSSSSADLLRVLHNVKPSSVGVLETAQAMPRGDAMYGASSSATHSGEGHTNRGRLTSEPPADFSIPVAAQHKTSPTTTTTYAPTSPLDMASVSAGLGFMPRQSGRLLGPIESVVEDAHVLAALHMLPALRMPRVATRAW